MDQGTASDFIGAFQKLASVSSEATLLISGGEPCIHQEFLPIVKAGASLFRRVVVNTNGLFPDKVLKAANDSLIGAQVSVDGPQAAHDAIRGPGTFSRTLDGIRVLCDAGLDVTVATTVSESNIEVLEDLDVALADIPFARWTLQREVVYGRAERGNGVSTDRWNDFARYVSKFFENRNRIRIRLMYAAVERPDTPVPVRSDEEMLWANCGTGRSKLYLNPDLSCFPCGCLEGVHLGDLRTSTIGEILEAVGKLPVGWPASSPCSTCRFVQVCQGGCPGAAYNFFGDFRAGDPRCPLVASAGLKQVW